MQPKKHSVRGGTAVCLIAGLGILTLLSGTTTLNAQEELPTSIRVKPWLHLGAEIGGRFEYEHAAQSGTGENEKEFYSRSRMRFQIRATPWLRFSTQVQDSRILVSRDDETSLDHEDVAEVRTAYAEIGPEEGNGWKFRIGRQPIDLGDGRLVATDSSWDNRNRYFDGIRATWTRGSWDADAFFTHPVDPLPVRFDRTNPAELWGLAGSWRSSENGPSINPYLLVRRTPDRDGMAPGTLISPGIRFSIAVARGWSTNVEVVAQRGDRMGVPVSAWAGNWELTRPITIRSKPARVTFGYGHASGDGQPSDRRYGTFDDLYPAAYNGCGFVEPIAWRNVRNLYAAAEWAPRPRWRLAAEVHHYRRATTSDGVYVDEDDALGIVNSASANLGYRKNLMIRRDLTGYSSITVGYAHYALPASLQGAGIPQDHTYFIALTARL